MKRTDMENNFYPIFTRGRGSTKNKKVVYDKANSTKGNNGHEYMIKHSRNFPLYLVRM